MEDSPLSLDLRTTYLIKSASICRYLLTYHASYLWTDNHGKSLGYIVMFSVLFYPLDGIIRKLKDFSVEFTTKDLENRGIVHHGAIRESISQDLIDILRIYWPLFVSDQDKYSQTPLLHATQAVQHQSRFSFQKSNPNGTNGRPRYCWELRETVSEY